MATKKISWLLPIFILSAQYQVRILNYCARQVTCFLSENLKDARPMSELEKRITQVTRIRRVRPAFEVQNPPTRQRSIKPASVCNWSIAMLQSCPQNYTTRTEKGCNKFSPRRSRSRYCLIKIKKAESDHVTVSCARSLESNFFSFEFFLDVLMDMPKFANVIGLLSSDESSDSNEAMPVRKKQRVREHSSTTFELKWSKTWPCIQPLKTDLSKATCTVRLPTHVLILQA